MRFIINGAGERCRAVNTEEDAIRLVEITEWYVDYDDFMC